MLMMKPSTPCRPGKFHLAGMLLIEHLSKGNWTTRARLSAVHMVITALWHCSAAKLLYQQLRL